MRFLCDTLVMTLHQARRLVVLVLGLSVFVFGIALLVLPGPAFVVIPLGLGILSLEFAWARRWLSKLRQTANTTAEHLRQRMGASQKSNATSETTP